MSGAVVILIRRSESLGGRNQKPVHSQYRRTTFNPKFLCRRNARFRSRASIGRDQGTMTSSWRSGSCRARQLPQLKVATNLSSMVGHPLPIARRTPDSHTLPCKDRGNRIYIDMAQVETLPCVLERIRQGQRIPSLPYSEAGLQRSDRDSPSYAYDSLCGTPIIRLRLLLIQLADANGAPRSSREAGQSAMCVSGRWC